MEIWEEIAVEGRLSVRDFGVMAYIAISRKSTGEKVAIFIKSTL